MRVGHVIHWGPSTTAWWAQTGLHSPPEPWKWPESASCDPGTVHRRFQCHISGLPGKSSGNMNPFGHGNVSETPSLSCCLQMTSLLWFVFCGLSRLSTESLHVTAPSLWCHPLLLLVGGWDFASGDWDLNVLTKAREPLRCQYLPHLSQDFREK